MKIIFLLLVALALGGCSKAGSLISQANGSKQMHSKWKLEVGRISGGKVPYEVELWVDGGKFRFHRTSREGLPNGHINVKESDVLYDGSDIYLFHDQLNGGQVSSFAEKEASPGSKVLQLVTFWKVPDFPYDLSGTQKVGDHECQVLTTTQMDMLHQEIRISCFVDPTDGIMRKRVDGSGNDKSEALYGTKFELLEVEMKPTFPADFFKLPADVKDIKPAMSIVRLW